MIRLNLLLLGFVTSLLSGFILFSPSYALAESGRYSDWHMGPGMMGFWGWFPLIFFVGMIYFMMSRGSVGCMGHKHHQEETPLSILKTRYAKGELSKKDFERMKKELE